MRSWHAVGPPQKMEAPLEKTGPEAPLEKKGPLAIGKWTLGLFEKALFLFLFFLFSSPTSLAVLPPTCQLEPPKPLQPVSSNHTCELPGLVALRCKNAVDAKGVLSSAAVCIWAVTCAAKWPRVVLMNFPTCCPQCQNKGCMLRLSGRWRLCLYGLRPSFP